VVKGYGHLLRQISPEQRLMKAFELSKFSKKLFIHGLRKRFPDLEGIEIKSSIQKGGWQGHNPEECWVMVFRYTIERQNNEKSSPLTFIEILCAKLLEIVTRSELLCLP
jgi:hypothetical protein